ncbi:hypothetical protein Ahu01nite_048910 [Winogradskya humida]|uniref:Uncharacterized protein n=1 Tax=Winogradskya humida TaxID=113566 RepID=A0ABQ3ZTA7_9ACTN|nr:hypothetical protein Ahu01nite_048910 [Actinoplanes humidus]
MRILYRTFGKILDAIPAEPALEPVVAQEREAGATTEIQGVRLVRRPVRPVELEEEASEGRVDGCQKCGSPPK